MLPARQPYDPLAPVPYPATNAGGEMNPLALTSDVGDQRKEQEKEKRAATLDALAAIQPQNPYRSAG